MHKSQDFLLRDAWTQFDRATALGCAQRGLPYDPRTMQHRWVEYLIELEHVMEHPGSAYYGDARDD